MNKKNLTEKLLFNIFNDTKIIRLCKLRCDFERNMGEAIMNYVSLFPYVMYLKDINSNTYSEWNERLERSKNTLACAKIVGWNRTIIVDNLVSDYLEYDKDCELKRKARQWFDLYNSSSSNKIPEATILKYVNQTSLDFLSKQKCEHGESLLIILCYYIYDMKFVNLFV